jgi:hypothetical protein
MTGTGPGWAGPTFRTRAGHVRSLSGVGGRAVP